MKHALKTLGKKRIRSLSEEDERDKDLLLVTKMAYKYKHK